MPCTIAYAQWCPPCSSHSCRPCRPVKPGAETVYVRQDLSRPWEDPLPEAGERHLAQELRGVGLGGFEMPEWKTKALGKAPTFGIRDVRSIKEQRESLPVYEYRDQIIESVKSNQVGICMPAWCWQSGLGALFL